MSSLNRGLNSKTRDEEGDDADGDRETDDEKRRRQEMMRIDERVEEKERTIQLSLARPLRRSTIRRVRWRRALVSTPGLGENIVIP